LRTCRDWQNAPAFLEVLRKIAGTGAESHARKIRALEARPISASLHFEERRNGICVVRIGDHYRAVGLRERDVVAWFWIGTHEQYNRFRF
jgi:hypothetical protein